MDRQSGQPLDVQESGPKVSHGSVPMELLVGNPAQLPARLMLARVPEEVIEQRQERMREDAKRRGKAQANPEVLQRAKGTTLLSNVAAEQLRVSEVSVLQRARWQIERVFRVWRDAGKIAAWQGRTPWRMLCELYATGMAMLMPHWRLVLGTWHDP